MSSVVRSQRKASEWSRSDWAHRDAKATALAIAPGPKMPRTAEPSVGAIRAAKYRQSRFTPRDDQRLLKSSSFEELQATIRALAAEAHYSEGAVKRRAQKLGIWDKWVSPRRQITVKEKMGSLPRLLGLWLQASLLDRLHHTDVYSSPELLLAGGRRHLSEKSLTLIGNVAAHESRAEAVA